MSGEEGVVLKDWGGKLSVALIYPNSYFVGMSNLGFQSIYGLLNQHDGIVCERVFDEGREPLSIESQRPLGDFDVLAFSLSYELDFFNAVQVLRAGGIPLFSAERGEQHPLVIAGGAAVMANPQPLSRLIDAFAIGEAEAILPGLIRVVLERMQLSRHELLEALGGVSGMYVPMLGDQLVVHQKPDDLFGFTTGSVALTPDTELGDLYLMEIARGCPRGCRFCLAGFHFRPMRYRPLEMLLEQAQRGSTYRQRMGLVSAAVSDHPQIDDLVLGLRKMDLDLSVSSIRIRPLSDVVLGALADSGTRSVALAPEAGSERLRRTIRKGVSEEDILDAVARAAAHGLRQIKLYFMIGLPTETEEDIMDMVRLTLSAKEMANAKGTGAQMTLNITPFVPKAGTPFQWLPMATGGNLKDRLDILRKGLSHKGIDVKADSIDWALVQGMLARGDSDMGEAIAGMTERSLAAFKKALKRTQIDLDSVHREIEKDKPLPWSMIDTGVDLDYLREEMERALG